jgi:hypothetical protein
MDYFDACVPGTGPIGLVASPATSLDFEKFNGSYDLSLRSKSDLNLNPQPEANVKLAGPNSPENREGIYVLETDRGELYPTIETQINMTGQQTFQSRLQDDIRPTTKETTLYSYDGHVGTITKNQALYTQFIPQYAKIGNNTVRVGGSSNYGLRTATEYSYFAGASPTGINGSIIQNPDSAIGKNTQPVADFNVDGPGTFNGAIPDAARFQNYRLITQPTASGLKFNYNLETQGSDLHDHSLLLNKHVDGIENRYTASYQIAPLLTNPLNVIWDPDNKGEIPSFYTNTNPQDFSYMHMVDLPKDQYVNEGYNDVWAPDSAKTSSNAYVLGMSAGLHNPEIEWKQATNDRPGVIYGDKALPGTSYSGNRSVEDLFMNDPVEIKRAFPYLGPNEYTTLGDPLAGFVGLSVK